jgi:small-conductance mechanosensitive channel
MNVKETIVEKLLNWTPFSASLILGILFLFVLQKIIEKKTQNSVNENKIYFQLTIFFLFIMFLIVLILALPITEAVKGQLLSLLGITLTAAIALSSTTFLGNMMAGLMLRVLNKYRPGDFLIIDSHFGRITELGFLHTEIQTVDRDLTTLPNHYLVTNPVRVIRFSGTIISEEITLGYDVHHNRIEKSLIKAAEKSELENPFMHIQKLGDFSVTYRISGFLKDVKSIISAKAKLREHILDTIHSDGIEIVSPNFMNQRVYDVKTQFIPKYERDGIQVNSERPEEVIFDKADDAETTENLKERVESVEKEIASLKEDKTIDIEEKKTKMERLEKRRNVLLEYIKKRNEPIKDS